MKHGVVQLKMVCMYIKDDYQEYWNDLIQNSFILLDINYLIK